MYTVVYGHDRTSLNKRNTVLNQMQAKVTRLSPNTKYYFIIHTSNRAGEVNSNYAFFQTIKCKYNKDGCQIMTFL